MTVATTSAVNNIKVSAERKRVGFTPAPDGGCYGDKGCQKLTHTIVTTFSDGRMEYTCMSCGAKKGSPNTTVKYC